MDFIFEIIVSMFNPLTLILILFGVCVGIFVGAMPGLNGPIGVALLLPLTYGLSPENGLLMLGGIYMGTGFGGSVSAILLNCPGAGVAACTALEGYPLALKGRGKEALYYSVLSSSIGGLVGLLAMIFFTPLLVEVALKFGSAEMFLVAVAGLAVVGSILGKSPSRGFFAVALGLLISMVGIDSMAVGKYRLTFGLDSLVPGIPLIPASVGFFAITEMLTLSRNQSQNIVDVPFQEFTVFQALKNIFRKWFVLAKSCLIGTIVGILPGTGGAIASFVSYGEAKRSAKDHKSFGNGNIEGIIAPESSNNAAIGGSFVPMLALGIPGSATSAIMFGALMIHGLQPGPKLFVENAHMAYTFMLGMLLTVICMAIAGILGIPLFSKILKIKTTYIVPTVLVFAMIGAYSARNNVFDVLLAIIFGFVGVFFKKARIPIAPIILGIILGKITEENFRRCLVAAAAEGVNVVNYIFLRPLSIILTVFVAVIIFTNFKSLVFAKKMTKNDAD